MRKFNPFSILFVDSKGDDFVLEGKGINDMPYGWASENEWNKMVYRKWAKMFYRCYNKDFHKTENGKNYIGCIVCDRWLTLSNFVEDVPKIDGYDRERFINGELVLDKDIKSGGKNKTYIIEQCLLTTIDENTKQAIKTRDNGYLQGENHPMYGKHHTEEAKQKISEANKGENNPMYGKQLPDEVKQKISEAHKGKKLSEEHKRKISENNGKPNKGKFGSEHPHSKRVAQYDKETLELIKVWGSIIDVERELGILSQNISACCKGKQKSASGFVWRYVED